MPERIIPWFPADPCAYSNISSNGTMQEAELIYFLSFAVDTPHEKA